MFKYEITYTDFNDNEQKETLRFHMSVDEFAKIKDLLPDDFNNKIKEWQEKQENGETLDYDEASKVVDLIKDIILDSYGEVSDDGRMFNKSSEIKERFYRSAAFAALMEKLLAEPEMLKTFINNISPKVAKK